MPADPDYANFFFNTAPSIKLIECVEIFHLAFQFGDVADNGEAYHVVRNHRQFYPNYGGGPHSPDSYGVEVQQTPGVTRFYQYYPLNIEPLSATQSMDQSIRIDLGDLGGILQNEMENILAAGRFDIRPQVTLRWYRSDDLTAELYGPLRLRVNDISFNRTGASLNCSPSVTNRNRTGLLYLVAEIPMLRGLSRA